MWFAKNSWRKRIAIVGNAPIQWDMTVEIDSCDLVLRFNKASYCGMNSGRRTDILCVTNIDPPVAWAPNQELSRIAGIQTSLAEVWFPRDSEIHKCHAWAIDPTFPESCFDDLAEKLFKSNNFYGNVRSIHFSREFNEKIFNLLRAKSPRPFICPSTGIFAIEYILDQPKFAQYDKLIFGFSFQGWEGHAWETEREIVMEHTRTRNDFYYCDAG